MKEIELQNVCRNYRVPVKENHYLEYLFRRSYKQIEAIKSISFRAWRRCAAARSPSNRSAAATGKSIKTKKRTLFAVCLRLLRKE